MNTQLIVLIVCLVALVYGHHDHQEQASISHVESSHSSSLSEAQIHFILAENNEKLKQIYIKTIGISNTQKDIESKLKDLKQDVDDIEEIEDSLKRLEHVTAANFQSTANSIKILNISIRASENTTSRAIASLSREQQDFKQVLVKVDQNQNRYERKFEELAKSVHLRLADLDNLVKLSVLKELVTLVQTSRKLEQSQKLIESNFVRLDELTALNAITANKLQLLEQGLRSSNSTTQRQLAAIGQGLQKVGTTTWQIDNKLGVLLCTQKNVKHAVVESRNYQQQPHYPQEHWQLGHQQAYDHKDSHKEPAKPDYETSYANAEEAAFLYQLWYGKDDK